VPTVEPVVLTQSRRLSPPSDAYLGALLGAGLNPQFVDAYIQFWDVVNAGYAAAISLAVEQITGKKPHSLSDSARDNADSLHRLPADDRFMSLSRRRVLQ
jgi:hypothetical protein